MPWVFVALGAVLVAAVVGATLVGRALPVDHEVSCSIRLHQTPAAIWDTITSIDDLPSWRPGLARVERLASEGGPGTGTVRWREHDRHGAITFEIVAADSPVRLVTRIADPGLPFGGTWTWALEDRADGTTLVVVTENGQIHSALYRLVSRYLTGYTATIRRNLSALAAHLGESSATVERQIKGA